jgi:hypothetical protein
MAILSDYEIGNCNLHYSLEKKYSLETKAERLSYGEALRKGVSTHLVINQVP